MSDKALTGLKVVELADFIAGPYCGKLLADFGAEVIKIEKPGVGDEARQRGPFPDHLPDPEKSGLFLYLNTNKLSISLNIETATGQHILKEILKTADVLIEDHPPAQMEALGLDFASLQKINPALIVVSITAFGQTGPYRDYKGYAINASALGGQTVCAGEDGQGAVDASAVPGPLPERHGRCHRCPGAILAARTVARDSMSTSPRPKCGPHSTPAIKNPLSSCTA